MRSCLIRDLRDYAHTFRLLCRPPRLSHSAEHLECMGDPERLPENLSHGKRGERGAIFDLELQYKTQPAPPPDPVILAAANAGIHSQKCSH
jgi:hypothetical protein